MSAVLDEVLTRTPAVTTPEEFAAAAAALAAAEHRRDAQLDHARIMIELSLGAAAELRKAWQQLVRLPPAVVYGLRERFEGAYRAELHLIDTTTRILPQAAELAGRPLPGADRVAAARAEVTAFAEMILNRWTSEDELVELMAETFDLPDWLTRGEIPPHLRPPPSWYAETTDPTRAAVE